MEIGCYVGNKFDKKEGAKELIEKIIKNFSDNVMNDLKKEEFNGAKLVIADSFDEAHIVITFSNLSYEAKSKKYILFIENAIRPADLDFVAKHDVVGVIKLENFLYEYDEMGKFENALKQAAREIMMMGETDEGKLTKKVTWKFKAKKSDVIDQASLFLDPAMKNLKRSITTIINTLEEWKRSILDKTHETYENVHEVFDEDSPWDKLSKKNDIKNLIEKLKKQRSKMRAFPSLLLLGPSGSGKSFIANVIYRRVFGEGELRRLQLNVLSKSLIGGILFGDVEGTYTGSRNRPGEIISNAGKALFLDEIADLPPDDQSKLLTFLDSMMVTPEGYTKAFPAPLFIIAATNKDIKKEMERGTFRKDLFYRFKWKITVPPLSERREDIRFLISFVLVTNLINRGLNPDEYKISLEAIKALENMRFEGNFRELEAIVDKAIDNAQTSGRNIILVKDLY